MKGQPSSTKRSRKEKKKDKEDHDILEEVVETYAQTRHDLERLTQECEDAAKNMQKLSRRTILDSMCHISPFRDAFLQKLGTLVDFDASPNGEISLLLESAGTYVLLLQRFPKDGGLSIIPLRADKYDDIDSASRCANVDKEHDLRRVCDEWDECPRYVGGSVCPCKDNYSYMAKLMRIIKVHRYAIIALMHEMTALYTMFLRNPESMYAKLKKHKK